MRFATVIPAFSTNHRVRLKPFTKPRPARRPVGVFGGLIWIAAFILSAAITNSIEAEPAQPRQTDSQQREVRQQEELNRGVVALRRRENEVFVSWRLLGSDPEDIAFHVYRGRTGQSPEQLTRKPIRRVTWFTDSESEDRVEQSYYVRPVRSGKLGAASRAWTVPSAKPSNSRDTDRPYLTIPLQTPNGCTPNDASVGDLDGDGQYEIVLKQEMRPTDNSRAGFSGQTKLEAYRLDGTFLWRIDLGRNIREGAHYTPFIVYDLDGDGKAEVACRTGDGTTDGAGNVIGDAQADHRNRRGYVLEGPEYLTVFDGQTGAALESVAYLPPRGRVFDWGDDYGNRVDRFLACVAYLDGRRPSLLMCRGYYTRTVLVAWDWRRGRLAHRWTFDSDEGTPGNEAYRGQGNHSLCVGDVDQDGRDEIVYGACCIDHDGTGLYSTRLGHGDALHLSDIDPGRPGLELFGIHERPEHPHGANLRDAATGKIIWSARSPDVGRGLAADIDPRFPGYECWAAGRGLGALYTCSGQRIPGPKPRSCNMAVWWDGDRLRELLDGTRIAKWDFRHGRSRTLIETGDYNCASNNGSKANPALCADILGDWREEVIWRTRDNRELRIFVSTLPTEHRFPVLMHDYVYRLSVAWQNVGYNQPTQPGVYWGESEERSE